jgi:hypothetical protein
MAPSISPASIGTPDAPAFPNRDRQLQIRELAPVSPSHAQSAQTKINCLADVGSAAVSREEIELAFIRTFQVGGAQLGSSVSIAEKHHRVRLAIYRQGLQAEIFPGMTCTWAEAYRLWSGKNLEQRAKPRPSKPTEEIDHGRCDSADSDEGTDAGSGTGENDWDDSGEDDGSSFGVKDGDG